MADQTEPTKISELKEVCTVFGDGIEFLDNPILNYDYTCGQYCMDCSEAIKFPNEIPPVHLDRWNAWNKFKFRPDSKNELVFLKRLVESKHMTESSSDAQFLIYWVDDNVEHIGKLVENGFVTSK